MELKAYFSDIHQVIIDHLKAARSEIVVAVAWFTDRDIFTVLCDKARLGVKVSIILIGDQINQASGRLNFAMLSNLGGQVVFLAQDAENAPIMHHKFCVIDRSTVITGSYNWSKKARDNDENITVARDAQDFARDYLSAFDDLLARAGHTASKAKVVDTEAVRRRLELIRNLVLLGEQEAVTPHIRKLSPATESLGLGRMIAALDSGEYSRALELIDDYLHHATAVVVAEDVDVHRLRFELSVLELRLESLSEEKAEMDRRLITFNLRHDEALGDLIQRLLRARAELASLKAAQLAKEKKAKEKNKAENQEFEENLDESQKQDEEVKQAKEDAKQAEEEYAEYSQQHEALREEEPFPSLSEEEEGALKAIYRKACSLCHPDKFPEDQKERATEVFIELQEAYKSNDIAKVQAIYDDLVADGLPNSRSRSLREIDTLKAAIAELKHRLGQITAEIIALRTSDAFQMVEAAGRNEADWKAFFAQQSFALEAESARIEAEIISEHDKTIEDQELEA